MYLSDQEFIDGHLTQTDLQHSSNPVQRQSAIQSASAYADSRLKAAGYTLPILPQGTPSRHDQGLTWAVGAIAAYRLAKALQLLPEPVSASALYLDHKLAMDWFDDVQSGKVQPDLMDSATPDPTASVGGAVIASQPLRGWR
jgi:hypothetical protein